MADFSLRVATPERLIVDEKVTEAQIPCLDGYIGVLPQHAPLLSELASGTLSWNAGGQSGKVEISGGFVEVLGDRVLVLADSAQE